MRTRGGLIWLEVLVGVIVSGFLILAGMRLFAAQLEQQGRLTRKEVALVEGIRMREVVARAWDARRGHRFQEGPWLSIKGVNRGGELGLETLWFRKSGPEGEAMEWRLAEGESGWRVTERDLSTGRVEEWELSYRGQILLKGAVGDWYPGTVPERLEFRFPDAGSAEVREGFAIHGYW